MYCMSCGSFVPDNQGICPNCGAPVNINQTAKCEYCDSVITVENHDFVLSSIRGLAQRTNG